MQITDKHGVVYQVTRRAVDIPAKKKTLIVYAIPGSPKTIAYRIIDPAICEGFKAFTLPAYRRRGIWTALNRLIEQDLGITLRHPRNVPIAYAEIMAAWRSWQDN